MKISVSNIAWDNKFLLFFLDFIKNLGCSGVEIAPSCIWPEPVECSKTEKINFLKSVKNAGLELVGFHSLLFNRPDLQLFLNNLLFFLENYQQTTEVPQHHHTSC